jgi:hypothetical protein
MEEYDNYLRICLWEKEWENLKINIIIKKRKK